jgi:uncharacterized protein YlaI
MEGVEECKEIQTEDNIDKKEVKTNIITKIEKNTIIKINMIKDINHHLKKKMINRLNKKKMKIKYLTKNKEKNLLMIAEMRINIDILKT